MAVSRFDNGPFASRQTGHCHSRGLSRFLDCRTRCAIETEFGQCLELFLTGHAFGYDLQADPLGDGRQPLQESLIAGVGFNPANEAGIHFQVIEAEAVQAADFAELAAEVFNAHLAAGILQIQAEGAEGVEVGKYARLRNLQPKAGCALPALEEGAQFAAEVRQLNGTGRQVDRQPGEFWLNYADGEFEEPLLTGRPRA